MKHENECNNKREVVMNTRKQFKFLLALFLFCTASLSWADLDTEAYNFCVSRGGKPTTKNFRDDGDKVCADVYCISTNNVENCSDIEAATQNSSCVVAKLLNKCVDKDTFITTGSNTGGSTSAGTTTSGSTSVGTTSGGSTAGGTTISLSVIKARYGACWSKCKNGKFNNRCMKCLRDKYGITTSGSSVTVYDAGSTGGGGVVVHDAGSTTGGGSVVVSTGSSTGGGTTTRGSGNVTVVTLRDGSKCTYDIDLRVCLEDEYDGVFSTHTGKDCAKCRKGGNFWEGLAQFGAAVGPWAASIVGSIQGRKSHEASMQAQMFGWEQCRIGNQGFLDYSAAQQDKFTQYNVDNSLPAITPDQYGGYTVGPGQWSQMHCNNYQMGGFAGFGGFGGGQFGGGQFGNPWIGGGYSPGMVGGMMGPYGGMNPYGFNPYGGGGIGIGFNGGGYPGMFGGGAGGMYPPYGMGGMNGGFGIPGMGGIGISGGMGPGYGTGWGAGAGIMPGAGLGGYFGATGGMNPYGMGGMGMGGMGGIGIGGMPGMGTGMYGNMYGNPGMGGGFGGGIGGQFGGGFGNPGMGMGFGQGYGMGYGNTIGPNPQSYVLQQQGLQYDLQAAQQALYQNQMMGYGGAYGGGFGGSMYGGAPYYPGNMGLGLSFGFGFGY